MCENKPASTIKEIYIEIAMKAIMYERSKQ